ncbi:MAG: YcgN family cysteine cluster protein [Oligoflexales bacterium]|nr:YcgN family cysteine cluster protein [Oligoflexales bacterium]
MKKAKSSNQHETSIKTDNDKPFWETKTLGQMSKAEWESLCDGCGRCCLNKVEYADTKEIYYTDVACKQLNLRTCQCKDYPNRKKIVPDCIQLSPRNIRKLQYMPETCAYRLLATGGKLPDWHPLISNDPKSVHKAGISVRGKVVSESSIKDDLEDHLISWIKPCRK